MRVKYIYILFCICLVNTLTAKNATTDSLLSVIENTKGEEKLENIFKIIVDIDLGDSLRTYLIETALDLSKESSLTNQGIAHYYNGFNNYYILCHYDTAIIELQKAIKLLKTNPKSQFFVKSYITAAKTYGFIDNMELANTYLDSSFQILTQNADSLGLGSYYVTKAWFASYEPDYSKSNQYFSKAQSVFLAQNDYVNYFSCSKYIAKNYYLMGLNEEAKKNLLEILEYNTQLSKYEQSDVYMELAKIYYAFLEYENSLKYYQIALNGFQNISHEEKMGDCYLGIAHIYHSMSDTPKALFYYRKSIPYSFVEGRAIAWQSMGYMYLKLNSLDSAKVYLDSAINNLRDYDFTYTITSIQINLGEYYSKNNQNKIAQQYYDSVYNYINKHNSQDLLTVYYESYLGFLKRTGNFEEAYKIHEKLISYINNSMSLKSKMKYEDLFVKYETNRIESENLILSQELKYESLEKEIEIKQKWKAYYIAASIFVLFVVMVLIYILFRKNTISRRELNLEKIRGLEKENLLNEQQKINAASELESRNNLFRVTNNHLLQQALLNSKLIGWLKELRTIVNQDAEQLIMTRLAEVRSYSINNSWNDFEKNFSESYSGVQDRIRKVVPDLSIGDFRILCFLIMRFDNAQISMITLKSNNSLRSATFRLRNKLNVDTNEELLEKLDTLIGGGILDK